MIDDMCPESMDIDLENSNQSAVSSDSPIMDGTEAEKSARILRVGCRVYARMQGRDDWGMYYFI